MQVKYSWVIPIKNEAQSLPQLLKEIKEGMKGKSYEIVAINDDSEDDSLKVLKSLKYFKSLKIINLTLSQGKWGALLLGFKVCKGQFIITSDSDLQDDPRQINKLLAKMSKGYDLVSGFRKTRSDPFYKVLISNLGNLLASKLTKVNFKDLNSPFKVYRRQVLEDLPKAGSMLRFSMLFADKLGYKVIEVPVDHRSRLYGKSKFGIIKYVRIIYDLVLVFLLFSGSGQIKKKH